MASSDLASSATNNTNLVAGKARMFMLTLNGSAFDHVYDILDYLKSLATCNYYCCCLHNKGHKDSTAEHIHIVCQFRNLVRLAKRKTYGAHIDAGKYGSIQAMVNYIRGLTGHDDIEGFEATELDEYGEMRMNGGLRVRDLPDMTHEQLTELHPNLFTCAIRARDKIISERGFMEMLDEIANNELKHPNVLYITGDSGSGKTYQAYQFALCMYDKSEIGKCSIENNFFNFINPDARCMVIEEFRPSQCHASLFLQFTDAYGFDAPIKGGYQYVRPETIIICSIIPSAEIYQHEELNLQFQRRIKFEFKKETANARVLDD